VENATALVETASGRLALIDWAAHGAEINPAPRLSLEMNVSPLHMVYAAAQS
jgi:hypothetical protein